MEKVAPRALASVSRPRTCNAESDPTRDQHDTDDWRNALPVTGLNAEVRTSDLDARRLGVRDRHDQGGDAEHNQKQSGKQQDLHI
jgi:hypothetical protein